MPQSGGRSGEAPASENRGVARRARGAPRGDRPLPDAWPSPVWRPEEVNACLRVAVLREPRRLRPPSRGACCFELSAPVSSAAMSRADLASGRPADCEPVITTRRGRAVDHRVCGVRLVFDGPETRPRRSQTTFPGVAWEVLLQTVLEN